jgi:anti-anti-sigma factor
VTRAPAVVSQLDLLVEDRGTTRTITPRGEIDIASSVALRRSLSAALDRFDTVVVDLGQTTFIDTVGVHLLIDADAHARGQDVRLVLLPAPDAVQRIFVLCAVDGRLPFRRLAHAG